MSQPKPVIVVVHGAWHQPLHYAGLINPLRRDGYTVLAPELPSAGDEEQDVVGMTLQDDADIVSWAIEPYLAEGREVVFVCHSYGALVTTEAAYGKSLKERAATGTPGGVRGIVFISAILFPETGMSSWDILMGGGSNVPPWVTLHESHSEVNNPTVLYSDVDKPLAEVCAFALLKQSMASLKSEVKHVASEVQARKIFVACKNAQNNPLEGQLAMAEMAGAEVETLDSGHSPFLVESQINELLRIIKSI